MSSVRTRPRNLPRRSSRDAVGPIVQQTFAEGAAEVAFGRVPTPIGNLTALVTRRGLLALAFETDDLDEIMRLAARKVSPDIIRLPSAARTVHSWLDTYFDGRHPPEIRLDRSLMTPFQDRVLAATAGIPLGEVRTYGQVAAMAGNAAAARATGRALGANPIPVVIPCHRVVAAGGSLHGYAGGLSRKRRLLDHERSLARR